MYQLKRITSDAVPAALEKALRYRLLNEPLEAESICRDILDVDPDNQAALTTLLLAVTDQFALEYATAWQAAHELLPQLAGDYQRAYYEGIIYERWAKAQLNRGMPKEAAIDWFLKAMRCYEKADELRTSEDPEAILRWNTCARFLERQGHAARPAEMLLEDTAAAFGDEMPER